MNHALRLYLSFNNVFVNCWDRTDKQGTIFALAPDSVKRTTAWIKYGMRVLREEWRNILVFWRRVITLEEIKEGFMEEVTFEPCQIE